MWVAIVIIVAGLALVAVLVRPRRTASDADLSIEDETRILLGDRPEPGHFEHPDSLPPADDATR